MVEEEETRNDEDEDPTEVAGETTAAALIGGPADTRPVGTGTRVRVEGDEAPGEASEAPDVKE